MNKGCCIYHQGVYIPDKFSVCGLCVSEIFLKYNIPSHRNYECYEFVNDEDIIIEDNNVPTKHDGYHRP